MIICKSMEGGRSRRVIASGWIERRGINSLMDMKLHFRVNENALEQVRGDS